MNQLRAILASILFLNFFMFAQESANEDVEEVIVTAQKKGGTLCGRSSFSNNCIWRAT